MTTRAVKLRIMEHRSTIRCGRSATRLTNHYLDKKHTADQLEWTILEPVAKTLLFEREQRWVFRLKTALDGLNDSIPWSQFNNK